MRHTGLCGQRISFLRHHYWCKTLTCALRCLRIRKRTSLHGSKHVGRRRRVWCRVDVRGAKVRLRRFWTDMLVEQVELLMKALTRLECTEKVGTSVRDGILVTKRTATVAGHLSGNGRRSVVAR